ncbi:MAG: UDP-N-acetylmuramate dehydrogenase, partial [bacterium]|nr:UDP-N-acetylmuramate dehydrogenase [bacterium]
VSECVIKLGRGFRFITPQSGSTFLIGCSMPLISLSQELSQAGFSGLEFAGGIPASVGGAVRMNAGAHGGEIGALIKRVWLVNETAEIEEYSAKDLQFSYRHSSIKHGNLIYKIEIELTSGHKDLILGKRAEFLAHRKAAQPITLPSSGSIFRNPSPELSAGVLIERTGLKGFKVGAAKVSEKHGNWIVNEERKATALDVIAVISKCKEEAFAQFQINLQEEIIIW